jgi:putative endonuclease
MAKKRAARVRPWFLYLLECANGSVYTGIAVDVEARFEQHRCGKGAKYTRANPPKKILAKKKFRNRSLASKAEWKVKQLTPPEKRAFARSLALLKLLPLLLFSPAASAAPECVLRVAPGFGLEYVKPLNARGFKVVTDPVVKSDNFSGFLERYVKEGEYGILVGGIFRGGFEIWEKGGSRPLIARWEWFTPAATVIQRELPLCPEFLKHYGKVL